MAKKTKSAADKAAIKEKNAGVEPAETAAPIRKPAAKKTAPKPAASRTKAKPAKKSAVKPAASEPEPETKPQPAASKAKTAQLLDSKAVYEGALFRVMQDHLIEPGGQEVRRDVIRHNGSVVILAVDPGKHKKDPWVVIERQYRHAAGQYLWELPAGKLDAGEKPIDGAKRELAEETGYQAKKWSPLVEYYASPGFLGESMNVFLAEGLVAGDAHPEEDEKIDFRLVKLSELLEMVDRGKIIDGKTLTSILIYARQHGVKAMK